jgi:hypothetical protein
LVAATARLRWRLAITLGSRHIQPMGLENLTDEELAALIDYVRDKLAAERFPYSPVLQPVKSALARNP